MDKKFLGICIVIASLIISGTLVYLGQGDRYKVAGGKVFDTREREFVSETEKETSQIPSFRPAGNVEYENIMPDGDFKKVLVQGKSSKKSFIDYSVSFTVKNNDTVNHNVLCNITYYNKDKEPIITDNVPIGVLKPDKLESGRFVQDKDFELIESYEITLEELPILQKK